MHNDTIKQLNDIILRLLQNEMHTLNVVNNIIEAISWQIYEWWCVVFFLNLSTKIFRYSTKTLRERQKLFLWIVQRSDQLWHHVSCFLDEKNISFRDILWSIFDFHHFSFILEKNDFCRIRIFKYFFFEIICRSIDVWNV